MKEGERRRKDGKEGAVGILEAFYGERRRWNRVGRDRESKDRGGMLLRNRCCCSGIAAVAML